MKRLLIALLLAPLCGAFLLGPAHAQKTKAELTTEVGTTFPDNIVGSITPAGVRAYEIDVLNSIMPTAPVTNGNLACFNGTTGLLQDCGYSPNRVIVGTTSIGSGSSGYVLYQNGSVLGEYAVTGTAGNAVLSVGPTLTNPVISGGAPAVTGALGISGTTLLFYDGSTIRTLVSTDQTQTLTNKTIDTAGPNTIKINGNALAATGGTATVTVPNSTDTLVGRATTDTLTNKTINGASNTLTVRLGSDVSGNLPLANIATGSLDTVLGYWGATTASAISINNCTGALTYSTGTHTFGCNVSAGTGTVTTITAGFGVTLSSGATCTTTCTVAVALTGTSANSLSGDVALNNTANYFDGPSLTLGAGRYILTGTVTLTDTAGPASYYCKLWDGTTVIASSAVTTSTLNYIGSISLQGTAAPGGSTTYKISCRDTASTSGKMLFNATGNSKDSTLSSLQVQ